MVQRKEYLKLLNQWKDDNVIKVITGIRRCGKSTLLNMFREDLIRRGVREEQIIYINFEDLQFEELKDYANLYQYIVDRMSDDRMNYIFLDEIQTVPDFQKAVDSLYIKNNTDIYLTGSNAYMLSGELATLLSGRYIEVNMLPLSFREYAELREKEPEDALFSEYLRFGSLPYIASMKDPGEKADMYLEGIYNTIIVKDIELRQSRKETDLNKRKITDLSLLKNIARFLANSVGNPVSVKSIADYITSSGRKISQNTVNDYVEALTEPYLFYPAERYDVVGKQILKQSRKLYISDLGIRRHIIARRSYDIGFSLENVVFLDLMRRGYRVNIGKVGQKEVDFVAVKGDDIQYFQVTASLIDPVTFEREISPLREIKDNYPKTIITLDKLSTGNYDGIKVVNAVEWLIGQ